MTDNGLRLALHLLADALQEPQSTLSEVREAFDNGERHGSYTVEHDPSCPGRRTPGGHPGSRCACGLMFMWERLRDARAEVERIRGELSRI